MAPPPVNCAGKWGTSVTKDEITGEVITGACSEPTLDFRNSLRTTWITPWNVTASILLRHLSEVEDINGNEQHLQAMNYVDLALLYKPLDSVEVRFGVNNLLDKEPPIGGSLAGPNVEGNGNTFPGVYDAIGQYVFAGVNFKF